MKNEIPDNVQEIGTEAFRECRGVSQIFFEGLSFADMELYVPKETLDAYIEVEVWNKFKNIGEL